MINIREKIDCCGCSACIQHCPKQCIMMAEDNEGFRYPSVDTANCIDCGLCEKVCPCLNEQIPKVPLQTLAVKNRNEEERMKSSSGGLFIALAKEIINNGGVVFGAVFDENWEVKHVWADKIQDVYPMMGSKYIQSRIENTYQEAEKFLKQGRNVMFVGTPCQIGGLKKFLRKDYDYLFAVDFICHGVPSPGVWRQYLNEVKNSAARRAAAGKNSVLSSSLNVMPAVSGIEFRDKTLHGWKKFSFVVRSKSASQAGQNTVLLSDTHRENSFMKGFLSNIYLRPSCHACMFKKFRSGSDVTLADYWGIQNIFPAFDDDKGVSLLFINSSVGQLYFDKIKKACDYKDSTFADALKSNPAIIKSFRLRKNRAKFYNDSGTVETRILKYSKNTLFESIRLSLIKLLLKLRILSIIKKVIR